MEDDIISYIEQNEISNIFLTNVRYSSPLTKKI